VFRVEGLSLSLISGRGLERPDPDQIQKGPHASSVGSVDVVGGLLVAGATCMHVRRSPKDKLLRCLVVTCAVRPHRRLLRCGGGIWPKYGFDDNDDESKNSVRPLL